MNTKKLLYSILAFGVLLAAAACTQNYADESAYEQGIDRDDVTTSNRMSIDRDDVTTSNRMSIDRDDVEISNK